MRSSNPGTPVRVALYGSSAATSATNRSDRSKIGVSSDTRRAYNCAYALSVGVRGFEPPASTSRTWRANQAALHPVAACEPIRRGLVLPRAFAARRPARRRSAGTPSWYGSPLAIAGAARLQAQRVERLDQIQPSAPERWARYTSACRSSSISTLTCGSSAARLVESQCHRDRHPAHRADLQVEHRQVGRGASATTFETTRPSRHTVNVVSGPPRAAVTSSTIQSASVASRMCTRATIPARPCVAESGRASRWAAMWSSAVEIVDVGRRAAASRPSAWRPVARATARAPLARRRRARAARRGCPTARRRRAAGGRRRAARGARVGDAIVAERGWTRLTTIAATAKPERRPAGRRTSPPRRPCRAAARRRARSVVESACSSDVTASARSRKPASMPANAWKKASGVGERLDADDRPIARRIGCAGDRQHLEAGAGRQHQQLEHRMVEEARQHAWCVEEVERVAARRRVDHDQVEAWVGVQLVQRLRRHVLLGAAEGDPAMLR